MCYESAVLRLYRVYLLNTPVQTWVLTTDPSVCYAKKKEHPKRQNLPELCFGGPKESKSMCTAASAPPH